MPDIDKEVQGVVFYAEFRKDNSLFQFFLTPEGYTESGVLMNPRFYRRSISASEPKKQWKTRTFYPVSEETFAEILGTESIETPAGIAKYGDSRLKSQLDNMFYQLTSNGWELVKHLFVEISKKDLGDVYLNKTPTKVIYRINQTRVALGLPSTLV